MAAHTRQFFHSTRKHIRRKCTSFFSYGSRTQVKIPCPKPGSYKQRGPDLEEAKKLKDLADKKKSEYNRVIEDTKKEVAKILLENNNKLKKDIQNKKEGFEKEINLELDKAQKNIENLKSNSMEKIQIISENIATQLVEKISGDKLNNSSIKAVVKEITKKNLNNYL